jgi:hypothetical protein
MVKFWVDDIAELYKKYTIIPSSNLEEIENYNAISRLLIVVCIITMLINYNLVIIPFMLLIFVVILYYLNNKKEVENFKQISDDACSISMSLNPSLRSPSLCSRSFQSRSSLSPCNTVTELSDNNSYYDKLFKDTNILWNDSENQRNSVENITKDLGNTTAFANNLFNPVLTCKENNLNCFNKYENLKLKR